MNILITLPFQKHIILKLGFPQEFSKCFETYSLTKSS
jgi:hypothetical protein